MEENFVTPPENQQEEPKPKKSHTTAIVTTVIILVIVILGGGVAWLAYGPSSQLKDKILKKIPLPVSLVNGKAIYYSDLNKRLDVAKKNMDPQAPLTDSELKSKILENLQDEQKLQITADKYNVSASDKDISSLFDQMVKSSGGDMAKFQSMLTGFGISADDFKKQILKPQALFTNLAVWYNGQKDLNKDSYTKAQEVLDKVKAGGDFGALAKQYSDDDTSKDTQGDMGTVDITTIIPEISAGVSSMNVGETKLISSRYGLHIIKVESKDDATHQYHIKQIFVKASGDFQNWYNDQTKSYKVTNVIKHL